MNTVLMQGYKIELEWFDSELDFAASTADEDHGMTLTEWHAKRLSLRGHYFWLASIRSHHGQQHLSIRGVDVGPDNCPEVAMVTFMRCIGLALGQLAKVDAKELVPEPAALTTTKGGAL